MKKILITGINTTQAVASTKSRLGLINGSYALRDAVVRAGWEVDQRKLVPGEDLSKYDLGLVFLSPIGGFTSGFILGAFYALDHFFRRGRLIVALDDWQSANIVNSIRYQLRDPKKNLIRNFWQDWEAWAKYHDQTVAGMRVASDDDKKWPFPLMAPTFGAKGDLTDLHIPRPLRQLAFDPSEHFDNCYETIPLAKSKKWIYSSLVNRTKWLSGTPLKWQVDAFGNKASGHPKVKEIELINKYYAESWGVLSPPTGHKSGLWWRSRYQFAAEAGATLAGDPRETQFIGPAYRNSPQEIEQMSEAELKKLINEQREQYYAMRQPIKNFRSSIKNFLLQ